MRNLSLCTTLVLATLPCAASAQFIPSKSSLSGMYPGKAYSPYAERSFPSHVFWGDTHLHTALSMDAGLFGARLGLDDAYRFARGEQVTASSNQPAKLARPLDWLVIADHSDGMGFFNDLAAGDPAILKFDQAKPWYAGIEQGGEAAANAALNLITTFAQGDLDPAMMANYSPGGKAYQTIWEQVVEAAERANDPGSFTALIGFEWTSLDRGQQPAPQRHLPGGGRKGRPGRALHDAGADRVDRPARPLCVAGELRGDDRRQRAGAGA